MRGLLLALIVAGLSARPAAALDWQFSQKVAGPYDSASSATEQGRLAGPCGEVVLDLDVITLAKAPRDPPLYGLLIYVRGLRSPGRIAAVDQLGGGDFPGRTSTWAGDVDCDDLGICHNSASVTYSWEPAELVKLGAISARVTTTDDRCTFTFQVPQDCWDTLSAWAKQQQTMPGRAPRAER